ARGALTGFATLNDQTSGLYGGVTVSTDGQPYATTTAPDGSFLLRDVPVGTYTLSARLGGYLPAAFGLQTMLPGPTINIGTRALKRQSGSFLVCRAGDATCGQGPLDFTGTRSVALFLTSTTAAQYRAGFTQDLTGISYTALVAGQSSYAFTLQDQDG